MMNPIVGDAVFNNDDENDNMPEVIPQPQSWAIIFQPRPWVIIYQEQELEPEEETREESVHKLQDRTFEANFHVIILDNGKVFSSAGGKLKFYQTIQ